MLMMFGWTDRVSSNLEAGTKSETSTNFAEKFESECSVWPEITALVEQNFEFDDENGILIQYCGREFWFYLSK